MVVISVPAALAPVASAVCVHGCSDLVTHQSFVLAYALAIPPWPCTTTVFTLASVVHFAEDVGMWRSVVLHASIVCVATVSVSLALALVLAYMCSVHLPQHARRVCEHSNVWVARALWVGFAVAMALRPAAFVVTDAAQRVACVHIALHAARPLQNQHPFTSRRRL